MKSVESQPPPPAPLRPLVVSSELQSTPAQDVTRLRDLSPQQWKSGLAAWLGWLFDGLDMHLYTLVAAPFVAELLATPKEDPSVGRHSAWIQAAFLVGWALGGGFFGRIGDRLGRSRALTLTILTYAAFTGLSFFAQTWWQLFIFRFLAALGIGGEWAVGASLLSETWPKQWRPWVAATLQTAVNIGVIMAMVLGPLAILCGTHLSSASPNRFVFLVGILPALLTLWIRRAVPEPEEWHAAKSRAGSFQPRVADLFKGAIRRTTVLTILVCSLSLTAHWAFMFWCFQHLRTLPDVKDLDDTAKTALVSMALILVMLAAIAGNYFGAAVARRTGYRHAIALLCVCYFASMVGAYCIPRTSGDLLWWMLAMGASSGVFALFTMYMPPLFPTLLRTTGAGFCYNIGRIVAAMGTVFFGLFSDPEVGGWLRDHHWPESISGLFAHTVDYRFALLYSSVLFLPAAACALLLPEPPDERSAVAPVE